VITNQSII
jgi:transposase